MATKKKRNASARAQAQARPEAAAPVDAAPEASSAREAASRPANRITRTPTLSLPVEVVRGDWTVIIMALMMLLAPAVGVPHEEMLQDTLKSIVVAFAALGAGLMFFWHQRNRRDGLR